MPQLENGYMKIANELIDQLAMIRIPGEAMQILFVILRKTYGFNKKSDTISLLQFIQATGIKKSNVCRSIKKLREMGLIVVIKKDNGNASEYKIVKDFTKWRPLSKKITNVIKKDNDSSETALKPEVSEETVYAEKEKALSKKITNVIKKDNLALSKKRPSKDNNTKDIFKDNRSFIFPDNLNTPEFQKKWEEWKTFRKEIRKTLTPSTVKSQLNKLSEMGVNLAIASINQSIFNGWQGLFDVKLNNSTGKKGSYLEDLQNLDLEG